MIDTNLPNNWQGSYGTLNTRRALAEINARLQALEAERNGQYGPNSAVMITRMPSGLFECNHMVVFHMAPLDKEMALEWLRGGHKLAFVKPTEAGAVLDALEANVEQAT